MKKISKWKKFKNLPDVDYNKYMVYIEEDSKNIYIIEVIEMIKGKIIKFKELYYHQHYEITIGGRKFKLRKNDDQFIYRFHNSPNFNFIYSSNVLQSCIDYVNNINKYNL